MEKLTNCEDDTCKFVFIMDKEEILGSVMAVQYTNDTWMVQHIVTSPKHLILTKELILQILLWMMKNKKMRYFLNYYQAKTRWAAKTYSSLVNHIGGPRIAIENFDYMCLPLSNYEPTSYLDSIHISEFGYNQKEYRYIYTQLLKQQSEILLNTLGLNRDSNSINEAEKNYERLEIKRSRKYLVAREGDEIVGFSFIDISSYGISLSLLCNVFYVFAFKTEKKEVIYNALLNKLNSILQQAGRIYSLAVIKPEDRAYFEKHGYIYSRTYSAFIGASDNGQFMRSYQYLNAGRK